jgi:uncharacterized protein
MTFLMLILILGSATGLLSGLLGIGGGIVMAPALLYLTSLFGSGALSMHQITGLTITQGLFAALSGALRHDKYNNVNRRLVVWMGAGIFVSALTGSILSRWISNDVLMAIFAGMAVLAAALMCFPKKDRDDVKNANSCTFNLPLAASISLIIGMLAGVVGQGGSFILIPLMLYVLRLPTRVVIGSNLALVFFSSLAGFAGKHATGQIPLLPAAILIAGALPGAQVGSMLSRRTRPVWLRKVLAVVVALAALKIGTDVLSNLQSK